VRLDDGKRNILGRSARRWSAPTPGQTALRRFRLVNYDEPPQIWTARGGYPTNAGLSEWVRGAWKHEFDTQRSVEDSFLAAPGFNFVIDGARATRDPAWVNTGARLAITPSVALFAAFAGNLSPTSHSYSGTGGVRVSW
jgi:hypothetical protein